MNQLTSQPRKMRWWIPTLIVGAAAGAIGYLRAIEQPFIEPITLLIGVLTGLLLACWYVFLTGLPFRRRLLWSLIGLAVVGGVYITVSRYTRVEGSVGGSGIPRLVWKWAPRKDAHLATLKLPTAGAAEASNSGSAGPGPGDTQSEGGAFPQFLGPTRLGIVHGVKIEKDWRTQPPAQVWRQPIGLGWSAFSVAGQRAVTQEQRQDHELVVCYELTSGRPLWAHTNRVRFSEQLGGDGPRATPTLHGGRVYAMGATGILDCLDLATGRLVWTRDVLGERNLSNVTWGKSCSPLLVGDLVVVTGGEEGRDSLIALRSDTGEAAWAAGRDGASYCSPVIGVLRGMEQILIVNARSVSSHDPRTGNILWDYAWPGKFPKVTQPLVIDESRLLIAAGYGLGAVMLRVEKSEDGTWSATEIWKNRNLKPKFTNLVRHENHVYGLDDGILTCLNLDSGQRAWKEGRYGHGQILLVDDVLLIQAESGDVVLVDADPKEHREVARLEAIHGKTWNNPILVKDLLLVRNDVEAACYRLALKGKGLALQP